MLKVLFVEDVNERFQVFHENGIFKVNIIDETGLTI